MRKEVFIPGEFYHVYNHTVSNENIALDQSDISRFMQSLQEFNTKEPIGSIYENSFTKDLKKSNNNIVDIIAYCLNPNHFHFLLYERESGGISSFMKRVAGGYTKYRNQRHGRKGVLFAGPFKARHVTDNQYLLHLSSYINLNDKVHQLGNRVSKLVRSSWNEYVVPEQTKHHLCSKDIILNQFDSIGEYKTYAFDSLEISLGWKKNNSEEARLLIE